MKNKKRFVDLHAHTNFSDGTFDPAQLVKFAVKKKLAAVAITDHDCVDGIKEAIDAVALDNLPIEIVPGVELAAEVNDQELHILGLYIEWNTPWFLDVLKQIRKDRISRMLKMIQKLKEHGLYVNEEEVLSLSGHDGNVGRLHLARVLVNSGLVSSYREVFEKYIGNGKPCYEKRYSMSPVEIIEMIRKLRGVPILAHPGVTGCDDLIPDLVKAGLMGLEVFHTDQSQSITSKYSSLARKFGLLKSGGSDCHGVGKGYPVLGSLRIPEELLINIKKVRELEYDITS